MLLHDTLRTSAQRYQRKSALVCDGRRYSYNEVQRSADALAACLHRRGARPGDRVAILLDNSLEAVVAFFAALRIGAVAMPINPLTKTEKLAYLLDDARASALVTHTLLESAWARALRRSRSVHTCIVAGNQSSMVGDRCLPYEEAVVTRGEPDDVARIDQDLAAILYTSGSTGEPKGVMLTHLNMLSAARSIAAYLELRESDVILSALQLAFSYGLYQVLTGFMVGATVVLERSFAFPVKIPETMVRERATVLPRVPTLFSLLLHVQAQNETHFGSLRIMTSAGATLADAQMHALRVRFPGARLFSMYGLTECARVSYLGPDLLDTRTGSVGRGMPNQELWLADENGNRLSHGSTGNLVVRGSHVMRGYWDRPAETANALRSGALPGEFVLHTGDIFRTDADGYLYFICRKDDVIKSRGEKVSPREVENVLYALDGVREAAVIGVLDMLLGQAVKAFVSLSPDRSYSERDVIRHCLRMRENYMVPKYVEFMDTLPKTDNGKISKQRLK